MSPVDPTINSSPPQVSVCVQTYQHKDFIRKCLDNIISQQTDFAFEIVLGEDCSTDGTREICVDYAERYPHLIRLFLHDRKNVIYINGRATGRYNLINGLTSARGKYIAICEGDDYWNDNTKLQRQFDFLENNPDFILCFHNAKIVDAQGKLVAESKLRTIHKQSQNQDSLVTGAFIPTLTCMFRNRGLDQLPEDFRKVTNADTFLFSWLGQQGSAAYLPEINDAMYRVHSGGLWSNRDNISQLDANRQTLQTLYQHIDDAWKPVLKQRLDRMHEELLLAQLSKIKPMAYFQTLADYVRLQRESGVGFLTSLFGHAGFLTSRLTRKLSKSGNESRDTSGDLSQF